MAQQLLLRTIVKSASKVIGIMWKLKFTFIAKYIPIIFTTYYWMSMCYMGLLYSTRYHIKSPQTLQKIGLTKWVSLDNIYRERGWVSLIERRRQQKRNFAYMFNGLVPSYVSDLIPPLGETRTYTLRNQNDITVPFCRTEISRNSWILSSFSAKNTLDIELRSSLSLASFKYLLKK